MYQLQSLTTRRGFVALVTAPYEGVQHHANFVSSNENADGIAVGIIHQAVQRGLAMASRKRSKFSEEFRNLFQAFL